MTTTTSMSLDSIRAAVRDVCANFPDEYWRDLDKRSEYPEAFIKELTRLGWLGAMIPEEYGGGGLGVTEGSVILEEINRSGGNAAAGHAQMYTMGVLLRHGSEGTEAALPPRHRLRRAAAPGLRRDRAERGLGDHPP